MSRDGECPICLVSDAAETWRLACDHAAHASCLSNVVESGRLCCPICRDPMTRPLELRALVRAIQERHGAEYTDFSTLVPRTSGDVVDVDDSSDDDDDDDVVVDVEDSPDNDDVQLSPYGWKLQSYPCMCVPLFKELLWKTRIQPESFAAALREHKGFVSGSAALHLWLEQAATLPENRFQGPTYPTLHALETGSAASDADAHMNEDGMASVPESPSLPTYTPWSTTAFNPRLAPEWVNNDIDVFFCFKNNTNPLEHTRHVCDCMLRVLQPAGYVADTPLPVDLPTDEEFYGTRVDFTCEGCPKVQLIFSAKSCPERVVELFDFRVCCVILEPSTGFSRTHVECLRDAYLSKTQYTPCGEHKLRRLFSPTGERRPLDAQARSLAVPLEKRTPVDTSECRLAKYIARGFTITGVISVDVTFKS